MTIDQVIAAIASISTCAAAIATFLTIRQMSMQRAASYRPELAFSRTRFAGVAAEGIATLQRWVPEPSDENSTAPDATSENVELRLPLHNVGLGAAMSVSLTWSFNMELTVTRVNESAQKALIPAYFTFEDGMLSFKSESLGSEASFWKNQHKIFLDFVLPAAAADEPLMLTVPHSYIKLCSALIYFEVHRKAERVLEWLPPLFADLEYLDIGGHHHHVRFEFTLSLVASLRQGKYTFGFVECKRATSP